MLFPQASISLCFKLNQTFIFYFIFLKSNLQQIFIRNTKIREKADVNIFQLDVSCHMHLKLIAKLKKKTEKPVFILMPNFNTFILLKVQHVLIKRFDGNFK